MCTVLLPPGVSPTAVKYIISRISYVIYHIIYRIINIIFHIIYYIIRDGNIRADDVF